MTVDPAPASISALSTLSKTLDFMLSTTDPETRAYLASIIKAGCRVSDAESKARDAQGTVKYFSNSMTGIVIDGRLHRMWGSQRDALQFR